MQKWLLRFLALAAALLLVVLGAGYGLLRASLPDLDGTLVDERLDGAASIARDANGVPVITAGSRADLAFATGVAHGQDRYFQMDLIRRQAAGELAELFGPTAVDTDRYHRFHGFRAIAGRVLASLAADERLLLERYAAGVNAGLASLAAQPFEYYVVRRNPAPWTAEDSLVVVYAMFMDLNDERADRDLRHGLAKRVLAPSVYAWLYPDGTPWDAPILGDPRPVAAWPAPEDYDLRATARSTAAAAAVEPTRFDGSNNWAVSGALTTTGRAMVANDMHLGLSVPNIWYRVRLVQTGAGKRDLTGVSLPGTPLVVVGSNGRIAWAYTNSYGDWSDAVILRPGSRPGTYRTPNGERTFTLRREIIAVAGAPDVELRVRETIWGPVDEAAAYPDGEIAVSWIAHHPRAVNLRLLDLETATSVPEALDIANQLGLPPQNFVAGDADGNIGWTIAGQIPVRAMYDASVPADWSSVPGWTGWREPADTRASSIRRKGASGRRMRGSSTAPRSRSSVTAATISVPARARFATTCAAGTGSRPRTCSKSRTMTGRCSSHRGVTSCSVCWQRKSPTRIRLWANSGIWWRTGYPRPPRSRWAIAWSAIFASRYSSACSTG